MGNANKTYSSGLKPDSLSSNQISNQEKSNKTSDQTSDQTSNPYGLPSVDQDVFDITRPATYMRQIGTLLRAGRLVSYSSEVGEAVRPIAPAWIVKFLWGFSFAYVGADLVHHGYVRKDLEKDKLWKNVADRTLWHLSASIIVPAATIHTVVGASKKLLFKTRYGRYAGLLSTSIGLGMIPFIVHPIDNGTDWVMDQTIRKYGNYYDNHNHIQNTKELHANDSNSSKNESQQK
jgi:mitochondrial fission process protein 1